MEDEDDQRGEGRMVGRRVAGEHDCERVSRFAEEDAARILRSHIRTEASDWANDDRSTSAAAPMLSDADALRGTIATVPPLKGTDATASRHVRGTLRGQP